MKENDYESRIARNASDIQDIWKTLEEIKGKLLGRPSWPVMILLIVLAKTVAAMAMYIIMK